jgi:hypothetical protein
VFTPDSLLYSHCSPCSPPFHQQFHV